MIRPLDCIRRWWHRCRRNGSAPAASSERGDVVTASEVNYFGLAGLLIEQFGSEARAEAARLTREAMEEADAEATADWLAVEQAVVLLNKDIRSATQ